MMAETYLFLCLRFLSEGADIDPKIRVILGDQTWVVEKDNPLLFEKIREGGEGKEPLEFKDPGGGNFRFLLFPLWIEGRLSVMALDRGEEGDPKGILLYIGLPEDSLVMGKIFKGKFRDLSLSFGMTGAPLLGRSLMPFLLLKGLLDYPPKDPCYACFSKIFLRRPYLGEKSEEYKKYLEGEEEKRPPGSPDTPESRDGARDFFRIVFQEFRDELLEGETMNGLPGDLEIEGIVSGGWVDPQRFEEHMGEIMDVLDQRYEGRGTVSGNIPKMQMDFILENIY